jgi:hypothetical protein
VKTGEHFLCSAEDGDIGLAPEIKEAKFFHTKKPKKRQPGTLTPDTKS